MVCKIRRINYSKTFSFKRSKDCWLNSAIHVFHDFQYIFFNTEAPYDNHPKSAIFWWIARVKVMHNSFSCSSTTKHRRFRRPSRLSRILRSWAFSFCRWEFVSPCLSYTWWNNYTLIHNKCELTRARKRWQYMMTKRLFIPYRFSLIILFLPASIWLL